MFERIKMLLHRWHDLAEVSALSDRELDDLGMTRDQVERFVRMPADVPSRVAAMGEIFGLSATDLQRDHFAWVELLETCSTCRDRGACALVLERGELSRPQDCGFCLNAPVFEATAANA